MDEKNMHETHSHNADSAQSHHSGPSGLDKKQSDEHMTHAGHDHPVQHDDQAAHADHQMETGHNGHAGHDAHIDHTGHEQMFRQRFWGSLALSIPVLLFSPVVQQWLNFSMPDSFFMGACRSCGWPCRSCVTAGRV